MNPKQFLQWGGVVLLLVGLLGFWGVIGPTESQSLFGSIWWFDKAENWVHTLLGVVALLASVALPGSLQKSLVMVVGLVALFFGIYNFFSTQFFAANLERPADLILHLVVGVWALWASLGGKEMSATK